MRTGLIIYYVNNTKERYTDITELQFGKDLKSNFIYFKYNNGWVYVRQDQIQKFVTLTTTKEEGEELC